MGNTRRKLLIVSVFAPAGAAARSWNALGIFPRDWSAVQARLGTRGAQGIFEGRGPDARAIFFDTECPACRAFYLQLRGAVHRGGVSLQWIPVAALGMASLLGATCILAARDRRAALASSMAPDGRPPPWWGPLARSYVLPVLSNGALLRRLGGRPVVTPSVVSLAKDGRAYFTRGLARS